jgi:hypothetical protein
MMGRRCTGADFFHHKGHEEHKDEYRILSAFDFVAFVNFVVRFNTEAIKSGFKFQWRNSDLWLMSIQLTKIDVRVVVCV